jgi:hypothetical protein
MQTSSGGAAFPALTTQTAPPEEKCILKPVLWAGKLSVA